MLIDKWKYRLHVYYVFQNDLKANIAILEEKEESLKKSLETLEKVDEIDVDEAVTTTAPLYKQYEQDHYYYIRIVQFLSLPLSLSHVVDYIFLISDC